MQKVLDFLNGRFYFVYNLYEKSYDFLIGFNIEL